MGGRNRIVGGRRFLQGGAVRRGKASFAGAVVGPAGDPGDAGAAGDDGADGTQVTFVATGTFDPDDFNPGDVVFEVDDLESPATFTVLGKKGDGAGGGFPDPLPVLE